jgi:hypothetical protein
MDILSGILLDPFGGYLVLFILLPLAVIFLGYLICILVETIRELRK